MRPLATFIWAVLFGTGLCVAEVREVSLASYAESVSLQPDGGATVTVRCTAQGLSSGDTIAVPYAYAAWPDSIRCGEKVESVFCRMLYGRRQAFLAVAADIAANDTLAFLFHLENVSPLGKESTEDFGNRSIAYRLVQSSAAPIGVMSARIVLPPDMVVSSIVSSSPARKANAPSSPYMLGMLEGRHVVTVTDSTVHQGDVLAVTFQAKPAGKSLWLAIGLALCAVVYLIAFRELLKP